MIFMFPCLTYVYNLRERCTSRYLEENIQIVLDRWDKTKNTTKDGMGEQGWYKLNCIEE